MKTTTSKINSSLFDELKNIVSTITIKNRETKIKKYFSDSNEFLRSKADEDARRYDPELIQALLNNEKCKSRFFKTVLTAHGEITLFLKEDFCSVINSREFLPNSFTCFENKIGLTAGGTFLLRNDDVVLSFPHKDCVLEGDQTKAEQKRNEIFFNEIIASDEITSMLSPKCFVNAKRYDKAHLEGQPIDKFEDTDNLIIKGNNLIALSSILARYEGKVKLIYIDPPYNTGNDDFNYNDSFNHSSWLVFMKNRLEPAKKLLREDGVIFVQCDDNEQAYLKVIMDEIFHAENFVNCISVNMSNMSNNKIRHAIMGQRFPKLKEYILLYSKNKSKLKLSIPKLRKTKWDNEYNKIIQKWTPELNNKLLNHELTEDDIKCLHYESLNLYLKYNMITDNDDQWKYDNAYRIFATKPNESLLKKVKKIKLDSANSNIALISGSLVITDYNNKTETARLELVNAEINSESYFGDNWTDITTTGGIAQEGGVILKNGKKPEKLLNRIIQCATIKGDLVLDFYLGSGTTCAVAHKLGRKYIGIEQMGYIEELAINRLKNVIAGDQTGISNSVNWQGGGSFVYCELAKYNQTWVEKIDQAVSDENLLCIYNELQEIDSLNVNVLPADLKKNIDTFSLLSIDDKKKTLLLLLDMNQLYYNFNEIDDETIRISDTDKAFTTSFYRENKE